MMNIGSVVVSKELNRQAGLLAQSMMKECYENAGGIVASLFHEMSHAEKAVKLAKMSLKAPLKKAGRPRFLIIGLDSYGNSILPFWDSLIQEHHYSRISDLNKTTPYLKCCLDTLFPEQKHSDSIGVYIPGSHLKSHVSAMVSQAEAMIQAIFLDLLKEKMEKLVDRMTRLPKIIAVFLYDFAPDFTEKYEYFDLITTHKKEGADSSRPEPKSIKMAVVSRQPSFNNEKYIKRNSYAQAA